MVLRYFEIKLWVMNFIKCMYKRFRIKIFLINEYSLYSVVTSKQIFSHKMWLMHMHTKILRRIFGTQSKSISIFLLLVLLVIWFHVTAIRLRNVHIFQHLHSLMHSVRGLACFIFGVTQCLMMRILDCIYFNFQA